MTIQHINNKKKKMKNKTEKLTSSENLTKDLVMHIHHFAIL